MKGVILLVSHHRNFTVEFIKWFLITPWISVADSVPVHLCSYTVIVSATRLLLAPTMQSHKHCTEIDFRAYSGED